MIVMLVLYLGWVARILLFDNTPVSSPHWWTLLILGILVVARVVRIVKGPSA
jgi:hypothetical protein